MWLLHFYKLFKPSPSFESFQVKSGSKLKVAVGIKKGDFMNLKILVL